MPGTQHSIRLSGKNTFKAVFAGIRCATPDLVFYHLPNAAGAGRMGVVVGRKAYAGAVVRNRLKRRLRALHRRYYGALAGHDVIIVAKSGRREPGYGDLERQFEKLAGKIR